MKALYSLVVTSPSIPFSTMSRSLARAVKANRNNKAQRPVTEKNEVKTHRQVLISLGSEIVRLFNLPKPNATAVLRELVFWFKSDFGLRTDRDGMTLFIIFYRQRSNIPVSVSEHARGRHLRADKSQFARIGTVREKAFAPAQQDRINDQYHLVHQSLFQ
jgi:hypothetical protein